MNKFNPQDRYFQKAKQGGYRARSAFKLEGIQQRFRILKAGDRVLDLGAAPGSFLQYISQIIGSKGLVVGVDLKPIKPFKKTNIRTYKGDIFDDELYKKCIQEIDVEKFDVITSDLAPATSGIKSLDAGRSFQLNEQVINIAEKYLKPGGNLVFKAFPGPEHQQLLKKAKTMFKQIKVFKPQAVRKSSCEQYIILITRLS